MEMTYILLKPLTVGGERREPGEFVPEAASWHNLGAYISTGKVVAVPKEQTDSSALEEAEKKHEKRVKAIKAEAPATPAPEPEEEPEADEESLNYEDLTVDEVRDAVESGRLTADEALEQELNREEPRKGVMEFLDGLEDEDEE